MVKAPSVAKKNCNLALGLDTSGCHRRGAGQEAVWEVNVWLET